MRVVRLRRLSFRLMGLVDDHIRWGDGEIWSSSEKLAAAAGGCNEKTIRRDISAYRDAGLFTVSNGYRATNSGQAVKTRSIKLAIPDGYDGPIPDTEPDDQMDNRCPNGQADQMDIRCPEPPDNRCPIYRSTKVRKPGGGADAA